jgi:hypothetical protein
MMKSSMEENIVNSMSQKERKMQSTHKNQGTCLFIFRYHDLWGYCLFITLLLSCLSGPVYTVNFLCVCIYGFNANCLPWILSVLKHCEVNFTIISIF